MCTFWITWVCWSNYTSFSCIYIGWLRMYLVNKMVKCPVNATIEINQNMKLLRRSFHLLTFSIVPLFLKQSLSVEPAPKLWFTVHPTCYQIWPAWKRERLALHKYYHQGLGYMINRLQERRGTWPRLVHNIVVYSPDIRGKKKKKNFKLLMSLELSFIWQIPWIAVKESKLINIF